MRSNTLKWLTFIALLLVTGPKAFSAEGFIRQGARVQYDPTNYLVFEDVGRVESHDEKKSAENALGRIQFGEYVRLHVQRGQRSFDVDFKTSRTESYIGLVKSSVKKIVYRDRDSIWIVGRFGHRGDYAALYSLADRKILKFFGGYQFQLSPDLRMVAYCVDLNHDRNLVVFVNETMVYPITLGPMRPQRYSWVVTPDGRELPDVVRDEEPSRLIGDLNWRENDLSFIVEPGAGAADPVEIGEFQVSYTVRNLMTLDDATTVALNQIKVETNPVDQKQ